MYRECSLNNVIKSTLLLAVSLLFSSCALNPSLHGFETKPQYAARLSLYEAIRARDLEKVKEVINQGVVNLDPPTRPYEVNKSLAYASIYGDLAIVEYIYSLGVDIDGVIAYGGTPLLRAAEVGNDDIVKYLILKGADVNHPNGFGISAMVGFAVICKPELIDLALMHGGDINKAHKITVSQGNGSNGPNPIQAAVLHNNLECVKHLISKNVNLDVLRYDGVSLKDMAEGKPKILRLLNES